MNSHYYALIMSGGGGTRLWPLSRQTRPKQMLSLFDERTLFQTSVQRLRGVFPPERIFVVTVADQAGELMAQSPEIPKENFLLEPQPRGTASVVGLGALVLKQRDPQAVMAVLTADHYIGNEEYFRQLLVAAHDAAVQGYLVTLGIEPTFPATGFGYIQRGGRLGEVCGQTFYQVVRFVEKPTDQHAQQMLSDGNYSWNSGMFFWRVDTIFHEFERQMPALASGLQLLEKSWKTPSWHSTLQNVWEGLDIQTIDYGVMEKAANAAVILAADLQWSDVGAWDSLFQILGGDENGNIVMGSRHHVGVDTRSSLVYMNQERRLIVTIGIEDLVVVDTGDVLLVCRKDQAQKVRQVVNRLKQENQEFL